ncbi:SPFH domain-containing protein [Rubrobacter marinus]|uniref:SPFH domain-containing protein n=1 Tax=Rubrobacter marinus TaxID=2653852 RepID=A0A6G8PTG5_9ACTN|nr:SPFH domain-containing protein [Rubrobacter marinus]QIN77623.1 SPFH domain-containing protein [Rubrobacter marinus]
MIGETGRRARQAVGELAGDERFDRFEINARDFLSARERGGTTGTRIEQSSAALSDAAEIVNQSFPGQSSSGQYVNAISPVVIPNRQSLFWRLLPLSLLLVFVLLGVVATAALGTLSGPEGGLAFALFGPHLWLLLVVFAVFSYLRRSIVMVPDGCRAVITRFGKLEEVVGAGRTLLFNPWKQVSYIVNTAKEYPYNAPIREAPTSGRVNASVDLFLQFRIDEPAEFIFTVGGVRGFSDKLENAISEVTRALIYEQRADDIYDLVGESTQKFLDGLNEQFLPAVRFTNANITHAEPSSQEYRMDLAAPEMVRVAKEAYTYQYELRLRKEQDEGDLNKEMAALRETLSAISAEIATYQAQIDTARERETNRANARARERMVEAESSANANAALLEAQALDIRAVSSAAAPEILEYRFQQDVLERLANVAEKLPQVVQIGRNNGEEIDFLQIARRMIGTGDEPLFTPGDLQAIRDRMTEIRARIRERSRELELLSAGPGAAAEDDGEPQERLAAEEATAERVEEIRLSVTDEAVRERVERTVQRDEGPGSFDTGHRNGGEEE